MEEEGERKGRELLLVPKNNRLPTVLFVASPSPSRRPSHRFQHARQLRTWRFRREERPNPAGAGARSDGFVLVGASGFARLQRF